MSLNWKLDITEYAEDGVTVTNTFTAPVSELGINAGATITAAAMVEILNIAFANAESAGLTQRGYEASAMVKHAGQSPFPGVLSPGGGASGPGQPGAAAQVLASAAGKDEALIMYKIKCVHDESPGFAAGFAGGSKKFQINFYTGPTNWLVPWVANGFLDPDVISAQASIVNWSSSAIAVFPSYYSTIVAVQDKPPVRPNVEFVPFRNVNNRVTLLLSGQTGKFWDTPVFIEPEDQDKFANINISQGNDPNDFSQLIEFKSDDPTVAFQIFRTTAAPELYIDFRGNMLAEVSSTSYMDTEILPNTKYYYCFRAIDVHGNISNPSPVYYFEMVDNDGLIYPIIEMYSSWNAEKDAYVKTGRRFVYIAPSTRQTALNTDPATNPASTGTDWSNLIEGYEAPNNLLGALGVDKVWNNIFKVRVTSKKTGRKVDLNLIFKNTGVIEP